MKWLEPMIRYFRAHGYAINASFSQLGRSPMGSVLTVVVIGAVFSLPLAVFVLLKNVQDIGMDWKSTTEISTYMKEGIDSKQVQTASKNIQKLAGVSSVELISPEQGLKELQKNTDVDGVLEKLSKNPLPWTIIVIPEKRWQSVEAMKRLAENLRTVEGVDLVRLDHQWLERFQAIVGLAKHLVIALFCMLGLAVFFIVNNAIYAATQKHRQEIEVIKMIGGTSSFIHRPFLYAGVWYGLVGAILAWEFVDILLIWAKPFVTHLSQLYGSNIQLIGINIGDTVFLLFSSIALSLSASWLAVRGAYRRPN